MRIKHWSGKGYIDAKIISRQKVNDTTKIVIHVSGNNECGICTHDSQNITRCLIKRLDRSFKNHNSIKSIATVQIYDPVWKEYNCDYTIVYQAE